MRTAILSDVHGNIVAVEAALGAVARAGAQQIVWLGDLANSGPYPSACLARVRAAGGVAVLGNADDELLNLPAPPSPDVAPDRHAIHVQTVWAAKQITDTDRAFLHGCPLHAVVDLGGGHTLVAYHGAPTSYDTIIRATTPDDMALAAHAAPFPEAAVFAGGHTHTPMLRRAGGRLFVNPGSVGLPYVFDDHGQPHNPAHAEWLLVDTSGGGLSLTFTQTRYDLAALHASVHASGMPAADWWLDGWVGQALTLGKGTSPPTPSPSGEGAIADDGL